MGVAHAAALASHASASSSTSAASFSWTHTMTTNPQGVGVIVFTLNNAVDTSTGVTYDGVALSQIAGSTAADTATEPGAVTVYFLGSGIPTTDNPLIVVSRTNNVNQMWAVSFAVTALGNTEIYLPGIVLLQENNAYAEQSVTDGSTGVDSLRYAGGFYGGATPAPQGASSTQLFTNDMTAYGASVCRETTAGQGARNVGFTQATADDCAAVHFAVREIPPAPPIPPMFVGSPRRATSRRR